MFDLNLITESWLIAQSTDFAMRDLLVAFVSIGLGLNILYAVYTENGRCYQLGSVRMLERNFGRTNTRIILYCIGGLCLIMGAYLVSQAAGGQRKVVKTSRLASADLSMDLVSELQ